MSNNILLGRALRVIYDYWHEHNRNYPTSREIADAVEISISHWGNLRKTLFQRGLLKKSKIWQFEFTETAFHALRANELLDKTMVSRQKKRVPASIATIDKKLDDILTYENKLELTLYGSVLAGPGSTPYNIE